MGLNQDGGRIHTVQCGKLSRRLKCGSDESRIYDSVIFCSRVSGTGTYDDLVKAATARMDKALCVLSFDGTLESVCQPVHMTTVRETTENNTRWETNTCARVHKLR